MTDENQTAEAKTGNVVKNTAFKSEGDWINRLLGEHCTTVVGAVEAVEAIDEIKDEETGEILQEAVAAVRGKKGKSGTDLDALKALATANNITFKEYPNPGMYRMNIGNMLRSAAKKRLGLFVPTGEGFDWADAPADFVEAHGLTEATHDRHGEKIKVEKPAEEAPVEGETEE